MFVSTMFLRLLYKDLCLPSCRVVVFRAVCTNTLFRRSPACFEERRDIYPGSFINYQDRFFHESKAKVIDCSMLVCLVFSAGSKGKGRSSGEMGPRPMRVGGMGACKMFEKVSPT